MSNFEEAAAIVLGFEGGENSREDATRDAGGATKYWISLRYLKGKGEEGDIDGDGDIDRWDIHELTVDRALEFYKEDFWEALPCEQLPLPVATVLFDAAVNSGDGGATRLWQKVLDEYGFALKVDGDFGPKTLQATLAYLGQADAVSVACRFITRRRDFYRYLAKADPQKYAWALRGWLNRLDRLAREVGCG